MELHSEIAIEVKGATKTYPRHQVTSIRDGVFSMFSSADRSNNHLTVFKDLNFKVYKGEVFGIIGKNGSGKSTLIKCLMGAIKLNRGTIRTNGKVIRMSLSQGFDNEMTARQNIYLLGSLLGLSFKQIGANFKSIVEFADVAKFVDTELKYYSTGMRQRLSFAISQYVDADIYLMDEFFSGVGDVNFKKKSFKIFERTMETEDTIVFVSHNLRHLERYCHRLLLLVDGRIAKIGDPAEVIEEYRKQMKEYKK